MHVSTHSAPLILALPPLPSLSVHRPGPFLSPPHIFTLSHHYIHSLSPFYHPIISTILVLSPLPRPILRPSLILALSHPHSPIISHSHTSRRAPPGYYIYIILLYLALLKRRTGLHAPPHSRHAPQAPARLACIHPCTPGESACTHSLTHSHAESRGPASTFAYILSQAYRNLSINRRFNRRFLVRLANPVPNPIS